MAIRHTQKLKHDIQKTENQLYNHFKVGPSRAKA